MGPQRSLHVFGIKTIFSDKAFMVGKRPRPTLSQDMRNKKETCLLWCRGRQNLDVDSTARPSHYLPLLATEETLIISMGQSLRHKLWWRIGWQTKWLITLPIFFCFCFPFFWCAFFFWSSLLCIFLSWTQLCTIEDDIILLNLPRRKK